MMKKEIFCQCSNCGFHFEIRPILGVPDGMYYNGYRAVGNALYCPDCVKSWKDRNGREFDEDIENPSKQFANWWNSKVEDVRPDKSKIRKYKIIDGMTVDMGVLEK